MLQFLKEITVHVWGYGVWDWHLWVRCVHKCMHGTKHVNVCMHVFFCWRFQNLSFRWCNELIVPKENCRVTRKKPFCLCAEVCICHNLCVWKHSIFQHQTHFCDNTLFFDTTHIFYAALTVCQCDQFYDYCFFQITSVSACLHHIAACNLSRRPLLYEWMVEDKKVLSTLWFLASSYFAIV